MKDTDDLRRRMEALERAHFWFNLKPQIIAVVCAAQKTVSDAQDEGVWLTSLEESLTALCNALPPAQEETKP